MISEKQQASKSCPYLPKRPFSKTEFLSALSNLFLVFDSFKVSVSQTESEMGSGCGAVGRGVASDSRDLQIKSSHWQFCSLSKVKKKEEGNGNKNFVMHQSQSVFGIWGKPGLFLLFCSLHNANSGQQNGRCKWIHSGMTDPPQTSFLTILVLLKQDKFYVDFICT